jgi:hypothetical protein
MPTKFYIKKEVGRQMICGAGKHPLPKAKKKYFLPFLIFNFFHALRELHDSGEENIGNVPQLHSSSLFYFLKNI